MSNNIVFVGFMGVGKGSVCRALAQRCDMITLDTDKLIESMFALSVKEIFDLHGESFFRAKERAVARWMENSLKNTLISTGGGFFKAGNLNKIGTVVLLDASFDTIYERLLEYPDADNELASRPLFADIDRARELYNEREPLYKSVADITIDTTDKEFEQVVLEIIEKVIER